MVKSFYLWLNLLLKLENKINRILLRIKYLNIFTADVYSKLRATGSSSGILYERPKIHKFIFPQNFNLN